MNRITTIPIPGSRLALTALVALLIAAPWAAPASLLPSVQAARDPVCGMSVDRDHARFTSVHEGKTYYFCSEACKTAFDKEPAKYLSREGEESVESLKAKLDGSPDDLALSLRYGDRLIKADRIPEAKAHFEKLEGKVTARADKAEVIFQLGYVAMKERRYDDALARWRIILDGYGDTERVSSASVNTAAIRYQIKDELDPAFQLLSAALAKGSILDRHLPTAHKLMLMMTYDKRDYAAAKSWLEKMPEADRRDEHIADSLWVVYLQSGEPAKGEAMLAELLAGIKDDYFALYRLAGVALDAEVKLSEALGWIDRSNQISKGEKFYVLDTQAQLLWKTGEREKAVQSLEKAIGICKNAAALEEMKTRLETYRRALKGSPQD
jgi:YHS domain-containing protein